MNRALRAFLIVLAFALLMANPGRASAEWFADLYAGASFTQDEDVTVTALGATATDVVDFGSSFSGGARVGYWFAGVPFLGLAVDASYFRPDEDVHVIPVSALLMLRWPTDPEQPPSGQQLQPYAAVGPGLFVTVVDLDLRPAINDKITAGSVDLGLDVRAGIAWRIQKFLTFFVEYRFTHFKPDVDDEVKVLGLDVDVDIKTSFNTHFIYAGIRF